MCAIFDISDFSGKNGRKNIDLNFESWEILVQNTLEEKPFWTSPYASLARCVASLARGVIPATVFQASPPACKGSCMILL